MVHLAVDGYTKALALFYLVQGPLNVSSIRKCLIFLKNTWDYLAKVYPSHNKTYLNQSFYI